MSPNDLFLCGHSVEEALEDGGGFYQKIIFPDDLPLWKKMYKAVLQYCKDCEGRPDEVNNFSCTFRLQQKYSSLFRPLSQIIFHRMKPVWKNDELHYLICSVGNSTAKGAGNLRMYNKNGLTYKIG